jgi:hypothetical protein
MRFESKCSAGRVDGPEVPLGAVIGQIVTRPHQSHGSRASTNQVVIPLGRLLLPRWRGSGRPRPSSLAGCRGRRYQGLCRLLGLEVFGQPVAGPYAVAHSTPLEEGGLPGGAAGVAVTLEDRGRAPRPSSPPRAQIVLGQPVAPGLPGPDGFPRHKRRRFYVGPHAVALVRGLAGYPRRGLRRRFQSRANRSRLTRRNSLFLIAV